MTTALLRPGPSEVVKGLARFSELSAPWLLCGQVCWRGPLLWRRAATPQWRRASYL